VVAEVNILERMRTKARRLKREKRYRAMLTEFAWGIAFFTDERLYRESEILEAIKRMEKIAPKIAAASMITADQFTEAMFMTSKT